MIIKKKVAAICKKSKTMLLSTAEDGTQWVGNGAAFYSLAGLPKMNEGEVMNAFDYTEEQKAKFTEIRTTELGERIEDNFPAEILVDTRLPVYYKGTKYELFSAGGRVILVNSELLQPVKQQMETAFFVRIESSGAAFLCVKAGMFAEAIVGDVAFSKEEEESLLRSLRDTMKVIRDGYFPIGGDEDEDEGEDDDQAQLEE